MDFLIILLILVIIAMVIASLLYAYDSRFVFVTTEWNDMKAWFKESKNQTYVIAGAVCLIIVLVLIFFIRRANNKHDVWVKSNDKFIQVQEDWLTSVELIDVDGAKSINPAQAAKFKKEIAENKKDLQAMERILIDRKVNPEQYAMLSKIQKREENDLVSATRKSIANRNESIKSFIKRNEKKLGKSAVKIARQDLKTSQKMIGLELRRLQKAQEAGTFGLEQKILQLEEDKENLKLRIEAILSWKPLAAPLAMSELATDMSAAITKAEGGEWKELDEWTRNIQERYQTLQNDLGGDLNKISDKAQSAFEGAHEEINDELEYHV